MRLETATATARQHLEGRPLPPPYRWVLTEPRLTPAGWLFEYEFTCDDERPPHEWEAFGGAPAFLVSLNGAVRDLSWGELHAAP